MVGEGTRMHRKNPDLLARLIVEHVADCIVLTDAQGKTIWVNPAFTRLSGYSLDELLGKRPGDMLQGADTTAESKAVLRHAIATRTQCRVDIVNYSKAGNAYISEIRLAPIFAENGELTHFVAVQRDVTDQRALIQESIDFQAYRNALELQAIVSVTDARGRITHVNRKFCEISGYEREELLGKSHRVVNSGHHDKTFFQEMWRTIRRGETWHREVCNRSKSGDLYWVDTTIAPVHGARGEILRYVSTRYDITDRKRAEVDLVRQAETDALTGLANRTRFMSDLSASMLRKSGGLVVMIDLDHFKDLNDSLGHHMGDRLLKQMALRLTEFVGPSATTARLGGDEFAVIVPRSEAGDPQTFMKALHHAACEPLSLDGVIYMPSTSMGVAQFPRDARTPEGLMINADIALYEAKRSGRKTWQFFDPIVREQLDYRSHIKAILETALEKKTFDICLQPICKADTGALAGFEILARLFHNGESVPPDHFIPTAEEYGLIPDIGRLIMEKAFSTYRDMEREGLNPGMLALNIAAPQFRQPGFFEEIQDLMFQYNMPAQNLVFEITETALIGRSKDVVAKVLAELRKLGACIALDDFGTGFSSLAHLRDFAVDKIKIDKSFVAELESNADDRALVKGLVDLARSLGLEIVAEGVETEAQADILAGFGCHYMQGYLYSRPLAVPDARAFFRVVGKVRMANTA